ncbi:MAG: hypothetical protein M0R21_10695 [Lentimicrobiaceae bacterium]|nr:hypothetical protein [Lentimicrobiaceae bacterium]
MSTGYQIKDQYSAPGLPQVMEYQHYYPFGMQLEVLGYTSGADLKNNYLYNGKELQEDYGLNWYDYGARMYDPIALHFTTMDPLADQRNWVSPYSYCQNSPIVRIDPTGALDDNYTVDDQGNVNLVEKTNDNFDVLYTKESWDNGMKDNSITVDKGILDSKYSQSVKDPRDDKWYKYDVLKVRGDDKAKNLFEFVAKNSKVEWSRSRVGVEGDQGLNYITTTRESGTDYGGYGLYTTQLYTYTYRGNDHSHDNNTTTISPGDVGFATTIQMLHPNAKFNIFTPNDGKYMPFNQFSIPGNLPMFEIIAPKVK